MADPTIIKGRADYSNYATKTEVQNKINSVLVQKNLLPYSNQPLFNKYPPNYEYNITYTVDDEGYMHQQSDGARSRNYKDNSVIALNKGDYIFSFDTKGGTDPYFTLRIYTVEDGVENDIVKTYFSEQISGEIGFSIDRKTEVHICYDLYANFDYRLMLRNATQDSTWDWYDVNQSENVREFVPANDTDDAVPGLLPAPDKNELSVFMSDGKWYTLSEFKQLLDSIQNQQQNPDES